MLSELSHLGQIVAAVSGKMDNLDHRLRGVERGENAGAGGGFASTQSESILPEDIPEEKPKLLDHRTGAHKLILLWPSVRELLKNAKVEHGESYVMEAEDRGLLRIYTRGEGIDEGDGTHLGGSASPARSEDSDANMPTPPDGLWGTGLPTTMSNDTIRRPEPACEGGLKPDGSLDLDVTTINRLYDSYMKNFHRMHPFLDKGRLRKLFDRFISRYATGNPSFRKVAVDSGSDQERPMKRQRSNGSMPVAVPHSQEGFSVRAEPTERSPGNAIVWLVMALGKMCLHHTPLLNYVPEGRAIANSVVSHQISASNGVTGNSPIPGVKPSPISPNSTPFTHPTPHSIDGVRTGERSPVDNYPGAKNLDVIPGLAYYAKAAEILGDQGDGNDLVHAQMFLLAGLYKGQLARVKESMSWISMAGRACMILLDRYKLYKEEYWAIYGDTRKIYERGQARIKDKRHSLIVLAAWTCLQLESDILAELKLPSSGILSIENLLLMPLNMPDEETEGYEGLQQMQEELDDFEPYDNILFYYTAQCFIRGRLNKAHAQLHGHECLNQSLNEVISVLVGHEETLQKWRGQLPPLMQWEDDDPPPADILEARLRAKYWGARMVVNRPFLDFALHIMPQLKEGRSLEEVARDVHGNPRDPAEIHIFKAIATMGDINVFEAATRCIEAAMHSTVAFDGVPDRLIVTNIHGTAHA